MQLIIPSTKLHQTGKLISPRVNKLLEEKISIAQKKNLKDASLSDIVGELTGLELILTDRNCGGYYSKVENVIAIKKADFDVSTSFAEHKVTKMCVPYAEVQKHTICHEISHALQAQIEKFEHHDNLISWMLKIEWEAESMAYKLYNSCFGKLPDYWFGAYFNKNDIDYLTNWHSEWLDNDLQP